MSKRTLRAIIGFVLIIVLLAGAWLTGWQITGKLNPKDWFNDNSQQQSGTIIDESGNVLNAEDTYAMPVAMTFIAPSSETSQLTSSVTVTCNHNLEYANVVVNWIIFNADGEEVTTNAITVTPLEEGSATATIRCNEPFGTKLYLKAYIADMPSKSAQCELNYVQRYNVQNWAAYFNYDKDLDDFGSDVDICFYCAPSVGTVSPNKITGSFIFSVVPTFKAAVQSYLKFDVTFKSFNFNISGAYFDDFHFEDLSSNKVFYYLTNTSLDYSDFIEGFNDYDAAHKNAIYYAWYQASSHSNANQFLGSYELNVYYENILSEHVAVSESQPKYSMHLSGEYNAEGLDDLTLSSKLVF